MSWSAHTLPATVTPFAQGGERVLLDWIPQHLAWLEQRGADGLLAMGTNGEGPSLTLDERKQIVDVVMQHHGGLVTVFGTGCASLPETIEVSRYALERGADAVLIVPPYYFKGVPGAGLIAYFEAVLGALPAGRKVLLYNIPALSGVEISDELVDAMSERFPERLLGIKDTSGRLERTEEYARRYPQLTVLCGSDHLAAPAYRAGAAGSISGVANAFPDLMSAVWQAHNEGGDVDAAQERVKQGQGLLRGLPPHSAMKHLLHLMAGLPMTYVRPPLRDLTAEEAEELRRRASEMSVV
jgi:4-hydroxy-tetrahydrodipicolinate synthase